MDSTKKKLGLFACIATAIGATIGSGIFGSLPTAVNSIGGATVYAFLAATLYSLITLIPSAYVSSVIPVSGSFFLMPSKLMHPFFGVYVVCDYLLMPVLIASFATLFGDYFAVLFPAAAAISRWIGVLMLILFFGFAYRGNYILASFGSILVAIMMVVIFLFAGAGLANADVSRFTMSGADGTALTFGSFAATVSLLASTLSGAGSITQIADDLKNPKRDIPITVFLSPCIVAAIYILMTLATLGNMPDGTIETLADVACRFLPSTLVTVFIVAGPILAIATSIIPTIMMTCATIRSAAVTGLFPDFCSRENKHGVPTVILLYVMLFSCVLVLFDIPFSTLLLLFSTGSSLAAIITAMLPFFLRKKYPHTCTHAEIRINKWLVFIVSGLSVLISAVLSVNALRTLGTAVWIKVLLFFVIVIAYVWIRAIWLKKRGRDLIAELKKPNPLWTENEQKYAVEDAGRKS